MDVKGDTGTLTLWWVVLGRKIQQRSKVNELANRRITWYTIQNEILKSCS